MVYFDKVKSGFSNKDFEVKKTFCKNIKKEMEIVIDKELIGLQKGLNFLASVGSTAPFVGLFWNSLGYHEQFYGNRNFTKH